MASFVIRDEQLLAVQRATRKLPTELKKQLRQNVTRLREPWRAEVASEARSAPHPKLAYQLIAKPTRMQSPTDRGLKVSATSSRGRLSGGMNTPEHGRAVEFGALGRKTGSYTTRRGGTTYRINNRHVNRQMMPRRARGATFYEAGREMAPRAVQLWIQTARRTIAEALEER